MAQSLYLLASFFSYRIQERAISRIQGAGKHEILPDEKAQFVAKIIERIVFINSATPDPDHVHMRRSCRAKKRFVVFSTESRGEYMSRNPVRAFGKNGPSVYVEMKTLSPSIGLLLRFDRS